MTSGKIKLAVVLFFMAVEHMINWNAMDFSKHLPFPLSISKAILTLHHAMFWQGWQYVAKLIELTLVEMLTLASESLSLVFREVLAFDVAVLFLGPTSLILGSVDLAAALGFSQGFFFGTASSTGIAALAAPAPHLGLGGTGVGAGSSFLAVGAPHFGFALGVSGSGVAAAVLPQVFVLAAFALVSSSIGSVIWVVVVLCSSCLFPV